jgi:hypothetical protein
MDPESCFVMMATLVGGSTLQRCRDIIEKFHFAAKNQRKKPLLLGGRNLCGVGVAD